MIYTYHQNRGDVFMSVLTWKAAGYMADIFGRPIKCVCCGSAPWGSGQITII